MTFGFEREFFVLKPEQGGEDIVVVAADHNLPHDGCGYLAEARGRPHWCALDAAFSLLADEHTLRGRATRDGLKLSPESRKLNRKFKFDAMRKFGKQPQTDFSMSRRWNSTALSYAGLHIHFGSELKYTDKDGRERTAGAGLINIPRIIMALDKEFATVIKAAKRVPGLYKLKDWGFEYRSLPATLDPVVVADFVQKGGFLL